MQFLKIEIAIHLDVMVGLTPFLFQLLYWSEILTLELRGIQHYFNESCHQSYQSFKNVFHFVPWWEFHSTLNHCVKEGHCFLWLFVTGFMMGSEGFNSKFFTLRSLHNPNWNKLKNIASPNEISQSDCLKFDVYIITKCDYW